MPVVGGGSCSWKWWKNACWHSRRLHSSYSLRSACCSPAMHPLDYSKLVGDFAHEARASIDIRQFLTLLLLTFHPFTEVSVDMCIFTFLKGTTHSRIVRIVSTASHVDACHCIYEGHLSRSFWGHLPYSLTMQSHWHKMTQKQSDSNRVRLSTMYMKTLPRR